MCEIMRTHCTHRWIPLNLHLLNVSSLHLGDDPQHQANMLRVQTFHLFQKSSNSSIFRHSSPFINIHRFIDIKCMHYSSSVNLTLLFARCTSKSLLQVFGKKNAAFSSQPLFGSATFSFWTSVKTGWMMIFYDISPTSKILKSGLHYNSPRWYTLDIVIDIVWFCFGISRGVEKQKKKVVENGPFLPTELVGGKNSGFFSCKLAMKRRDETTFRKQLKSWSPNMIPCMLKFCFGNNCFVLEWEKKNSHFLQKTSVVSLIRPAGPSKNLPSKSSDRTGAVRTDGRLECQRLVDCRSDDSLSHNFRT